MSSHTTAATHDHRPEFMVTLGLAPPYAMEDVKQAYRDKVRQTHPDRGGSAYLARRVYEARDTLLEQRRKTRTRTGDDE